MRILSVALKNFKSHADSYFQFEGGINAICGENGAGKTSILEAIAWVLFDTTPYTKEELIRSGATAAQVAVQLVSAWDERTYEVRRHTTTGYVIYDPQLHERLDHELKQDVLKWLRQQMGIPEGTDLARLFTTTLGVPQGLFTSDFLKPPRERKETFDRILKVEEYQRLFRDLLNLQRYSEGQVKNAQHQVELLQVQLQDWDPLQAEATHLQQQEQTLSQSLEQQQILLTQLSTELAHLQTQEQQLQQLQERWQSLQQTLAVQTFQVQQAAAALAAATAAQTEAEGSREGFQGFQEAEKHLQLLHQQSHQRHQLLQRQQHLWEQDRQIQSEAIRLQERLQRLQQVQETIRQLHPQAQEQEQLQAQQQQLTQWATDLTQQQQAYQLLRTQWEAQRQHCRQWSQAVAEAQAAQHICQEAEAGYQAFLQTEATLKELEKTQQQRQQILKQREQQQAEIHQVQVQQAGRQEQRQRFAQLQEDINRLQPLILQQARLGRQTTTGATAAAAI
ncbi:MAG: AAA family ATPase [Synechococcaceae cyanobacterium SM2_3_1]|nr:AAA family ATPase [Synechococcaceae cyanobacterium SM2_3_1]